MSYLSSLASPTFEEGEDITKIDPSEHSILFGQAATGALMNFGAGASVVTGLVGGTTAHYLGADDASDYIFKNMVDVPTKTAIDYNSNIRTVTGQLIAQGVPMIANIAMGNAGGLGLGISNLGVQTFAQQTTDELSRGTPLGKAEALGITRAVFSMLGAKYAPSFVGKGAVGATAVAQKAVSGAGVNVAFGAASRTTEQITEVATGGEFDWSKVTDAGATKIDAVMGVVFSALGGSGRLGKNMKEYLPVQLQDALFSLNKYETLRRNGSTSDIPFVPQKFVSDGSGGGKLVDAEITNSLDKLEGSSIAYNAHLYTGKQLDIKEGAKSQEGIKVVVPDGAEQARSVRSQSALSEAIAVAETERLNIGKSELSPLLPIDIAKKVYPESAHSDLEARSSQGQIKQEPVFDIARKEFDDAEQTTIDGANKTEARFGEFEGNDIDNMISQLGEDYRVIDDVTGKEVSLNEYMNKHEAEIMPEKKLLDKAKQGASCIIGALIGG